MALGDEVERLRAPSAGMPAQAPVVAPTAMQTAGLAPNTSGLFSSFWVRLGAVPAVVALLLAVGILLVR